MSVSRRKLGETRRRRVRVCAGYYHPAKSGEDILELSEKATLVRVEKFCYLYSGIQEDLGWHLVGYEELPEGEEALPPPPPPKPSWLQRFWRWLRGARPIPQARVVKEGE